MADEWEALEKLAGERRLTESQCRKVIAQMYERTVGEPLHFKTAREYLTEWVESKKNETELRAWLKYDQIVSDFLAHIGVKADRLLREITPADIRFYRDALKRKGLAAPTVNHAVKILRMPFRAAHDGGYIDINPNTKTLSARQDEARNIEKDVFTREQLSELIQAASSEDWTGAILGGYYTGLRLRDIADLRWSAVDLEGRIIKVTTRKTGKTVTVRFIRNSPRGSTNKPAVLAKRRCFQHWLVKLGVAKSGLSMAFRRIMSERRLRGDCCAKPTASDVHNPA